MSQNHPGIIQASSKLPSWTPHLLNLSMLLAMFVFALLTFDDLPDRYASHFNGSGQADGWSDKSWGNYLLMPLMALGITLIMYACSKLVDVAKKHPAILNIPNKEKFLALPPEKQEPIWRQIKGLLYWISLPMNVLFAYIQWSLYDSATGDQHLDLWPFLVLLVVVMVQVLWQTMSLIRTVRRAVEQR